MPTTPVTSAATALVRDFSLEMTGKDTARLEEAANAIPPGTRINVTFLGNEDLQTRVAAARAIRDLGFVPVPHISARRLESEAELHEFLAALHGVGASDSVFVVGGDPAAPEGPYPDAAEVIRSGLLQQFGATTVGIAGYPEGHPDISDETLWHALETKSAMLAERKLCGVIITQFGFDVGAVLAWVLQVRNRGITLPIRIGVPGPAGIKRLISYASRFGVGTSAGIAKKYGFSITNLLGTAGPNRFITDLAGLYDPDRFGDVKLHFYTFGGLTATAEWIDTFTKAN